MKLVQNLQLIVIELKSDEFHFILKIVRTQFLV